MLVLATPWWKSVSSTICAALWVYTSRGLRDAWFCARAAGTAFISSLPYNRCHRDDGVEADCCCERAVASWRCRHPTVDSRWELKSLFACFCWFCLASYVPERPSPLSFIVSLCDNDESRCLFLFCVDACGWYNIVIRYIKG